MIFKFTGLQYDNLQKKLAKRGQSVESHYMEVIRNKKRQGQYITSGKIIVIRKYDENNATLA